MKNKTITDVSNTVHANAIRNGSTWTTNFSGAAPTTNQVLSYNGTNAVWGAAAPLVTLAGDVTGPANNCIVGKADWNFSVGNGILVANVHRVRKISVWNGGEEQNSDDHRFHGLGTAPNILRYQTMSTAHDHVFYAATSNIQSNELARINGAGDLSVARTINCKSGVQIKKLVVHEGGTAGAVNNHDFQGFGTSSLIMRYHVNSLSSSHRFYAATSATASNELFMIAGDGNAVCSGVMLL